MVIRLLCSSCFALLILSGHTPTEKQGKKYFIAADTIYVIVMPVDYDQHNWEFWGFTNDWLQEEVVKKLNKDKQKKNIHFLTEEETISKNIKADRIIALSFVEIKIGYLKNRRYPSRRTGNIIVGYTNSPLQKPIYRKTYATIYYDENYTENSATLQYRIYNPASGKNILLDHFINKYNWSNATATYSGSETALSYYDWKDIYNTYRDAPPANEIAQQLIEDCYKTLISKIKNKVKF